MTPTQMQTVLTVMRRVEAKVDLIEERLAYVYPTDREAVDQLHAEVDAILGVGVKTFEERPTTELRGGRHDGLVVTRFPVNGYIIEPTDDGKTILAYEVTEDGRFADYVTSYAASIELPNPKRERMTR